MVKEYVRASASDLRQALEITKALTDAGLLFVPMPVLSPEDGLRLQRQAMSRIERIHSVNMAAEKARENTKIAKED